MRTDLEQKKMSTACTVLAYGNDLQSTHTESWQRQTLSNSTHVSGLSAAGWDNIKSKMSSRIQQRILN